MFVTVCNALHCCNNRCEVCDLHVVKEHGLVCDTCADRAACDGCGEPAAYSHPGAYLFKRFAKFKVPFFRSYKGECSGCGSHDHVNDAGHCKHCAAPKLVLKDGFVCPECSQGYPKHCKVCKKTGNFVANETTCLSCQDEDTWDDSYRHGNCTSCGKYKPVSSEGICRSCHNNEPKQEVKQCINCGEERTNDLYCNECIGSLITQCPRCGEPHSGLDVLCVDCSSMVCVGCDESFTPKNIQDTHCDGCEERIKQQLCTMCETHPTPGGYIVQDTGRCNTCHQSYAKRIAEGRGKEYGFGRCRNCNNRCDEDKPLCIHCSGDKICGVCNDGIIKKGWMCDRCTFAGSK